MYNMMLRRHLLSWDHAIEWPTHWNSTSLPQNPLKISIDDNKSGIFVHLDSIRSNLWWMWWLNVNRNGYFSHWKLCSGTELAAAVFFFSLNLHSIDTDLANFPEKYVGLQCILKAFLVNQKGSTSKTLHFQRESFSLYILVNNQFVIGLSKFKSKSIKLFNRWHLSKNQIRFKTKKNNWHKLE